MSSGGLSAFLKDIEPFFVGRPLIYVDVGANRGDTFGDLMRSGLNVNRAALFEPNPKTFAKLTETVAALGAGEKATCYNVAMSDQPGIVRLRDMDDMSKVLADDVKGEGVLAERIFDVEAQTLDSFASNFPDGHVSILKIDVEGYEAEVLRGAADMLGSQSVDLIYVEVGINPGGGQQTYYRTIEDLLLGQNYRLFKIYEQTPEWIENSPFLRRVNMAFMSHDFAMRHPFNLVRELQSLRVRHAGELKKGNESLNALKLECGQLRSALTENAERLAGLKRLADAKDAEISSTDADKKRLAGELADRFQEVAALTRLAEENISKTDLLQAAHRAELKKLKSDGEQAEKKSAEMNKRLKADAASIRNSLTAERDKLKAERNKIKAERDKLKTERNKLKSERDRLAGKVEFLRNSVSWRLTMPFRKIGNLVGGGRGVQKLKLPKPSK